MVSASDPELLITDEVLAVGDESFQKKCIRWIESFLERGNTLLMVSHSMYLVQKLCQRALWLQQGRAREFGDVFPVTQAYLAWHEEKNASERRQRRSEQGAGGHYRVADFRLPSTRAGDDRVIAAGSDLEAELLLYSPDGRPPVALVGVMRADGTPVYGVASDFDGNAPEQVDEQHFRYPDPLRAHAAAARQLFHPRARDGPGRIAPVRHRGDPLFRIRRKPGNGHGEAGAPVDVRRRRPGVRIRP